MMNKTAYRIAFFTLFLIIVVVAGFLVYPRVYNDSFSYRDYLRTCVYDKDTDHWSYSEPEVEKMSLRAVAYYSPERLFTECLYRATPKQKELLPTAYRGGDKEADRSWLTTLPRDEPVFNVCVRECLEIMHVIPKSSKRLTAEKAYAILSEYVPSVLSKWDESDVRASELAPGKLTRYEVFMRICRRLNRYAICEDMADRISGGNRARYDLDSEEGNLSLVLCETVPRFGLSAYIEDRDTGEIKYLIFATAKGKTEADYQTYFDMTYYFPTGN